MRFPRSLSARILVGFAVLVLAFGGISVSTVVNIDQLNEAIRIIRVGYLELALVTRDLHDRQEALYSYLNDDLSGGASNRHVVRRITALRGERFRMLQSAEDSLANFRGIERDTTRRHLRAQEQTLRTIRELVDETDALYADLLAQPPLERYLTDQSEDVDAAKLRRAKAALARLISHEKRLTGKTGLLARNLRKRVSNTSKRLEDISADVRLITVLGGITAVLIGIVVTVAAVLLTLRPLRRLRDRARGIAEGDYAARIEEKGPREIADLAAEFNVMALAIEERERELVRRERLATVGKMAAMITHEVRNPLSSIGLNTELLEEELAADSNSDESLTLCRAIHKEVDRLTEITEVYLRYARVPVPNKQEHFLSRVVGDLIDFEREQLRLRQIEIELEFEEELPPLWLDEAQIRQALLNVLRNSADALEEGGGGAIRIATAGDGKRQTVTIADNGPGIPGEVLETLFEPFSTSKSGGTGLGLALCQQIIREHGGAIAASAPPEGGARFSITLPVSESADSIDQDFDPAEA